MCSILGLLARTYTSYAHVIFNGGCVCRSTGTGGSFRKPSVNPCIFEPPFLNDVYRVLISYLIAELLLFVPVYTIFQRDQASLDSFRREYELGVRAQAERCEAAALTTAAAAATRLGVFFNPIWYFCLVCVTLGKTQSAVLAANQSKPHTEIVLLRCV